MQAGQCEYFYHLKKGGGRERNLNQVSKLALTFPSQADLSFIFFLVKNILQIFWNVF